MIKKHLEDVINSYETDFNDKEYLELNQTVIALGDIVGMSLMLLWWLIGVCPNNDNCFHITTVATWIIGMILGILGDVPIWFWIIYAPLFLNAICYIIRHRKS